ncbi:TspO/MBR family protein [Planctomicrobium sp. SH661]|uniref:TspO/MBR family protein n=1 Tax=Planctomicrobium sp. SH661 TaxID=3448124 RepID=UPI003F5C5815
MTNAKRILGLVFFLAVCLGVGGLGAIATTPQIDGWYRTLQKPSWNPPAWVFGPVWTTLYILMAIAAWLVWMKSDSKTARLPLGLFSVQLAFNLAWSWIFFYLRQPGWAFLELVALWILIVATTISFSRFSKLAAVLMAPYVGWTTFAGVLNFTLWRLNS